MAADWERYVERWANAGLIERATADLIHAYEIDQKKVKRLKWPILLAIALGGLMIAAGILLFVAAHWDVLSPTQRFTLVLVLIAIMHIGGAITAARFSILSTALHAIGTICLGAGIFLTGQIFHLQEHWPGGVMLWAIGACLAWVLLRDWTQAAFMAILIPAWLAGEWSAATLGWQGSVPILAAGLLLLVISYMTALLPEKSSAMRKALVWIGSIMLIPCVILVTQAGRLYGWRLHSMPWDYYLFGWITAFLLPLALAWWLRKEHFWLNLIAALWVAILSVMSSLCLADRATLLNPAWNSLIYALCILGSIGMIAWGLKEDRKERINLGIAGFALTVLSFYYSTIMDKLGRSASLIGLGILFLLGGWLLEKTRRRLIKKIEKVHHESNI